MKILTPFLVILFSLLSVGCLMTRDQIRGNSTNRSPEQVQVSQNQIKKAEQAAQLDDMDESLRSTVGRIEVLENEIQQMKAVSPEEEQNKMAAKKDIDLKFATFEQALRALEVQVQNLKAEISGLKASRSSSKPKVKKKAKKGNFAGAQEAFSAKDWKKAILGYQKYRDLNPKGRWYSEATYKIGVSFQELNMKSEAKSFYQEVIAKFPKGKMAKKAKYRLKKLK